MDNTKTVYCHDIIQNVYYCFVLEVYVGRLNVGEIQKVHLVSVF